MYQSISILILPVVLPPPFGPQTTSCRYSLGGVKFLDCHTLTNDLLVLPHERAVLTAPPQTGGWEKTG